MPYIKYMSEEEGYAMPINQLHENLTGNQAVRAAIIVHDVLIRLSLSLSRALTIVPNSEMDDGCRFRVKLFL